ncbi:hypothetical protein TNIN_187991 [Trichonephila inaurata madagascariensis]|uniref:Uncharacterized protein n=1 Tax=Trichonephila inaurata madagascariensis TaxID=2747483 RepID=A0A8X7C9E1_9ARAC|nr:hypothetical protein TNIN_187991 [Trichonephila inaurata madagascariensis]
MLLQPVKTVNVEQDSITQKLDELTNQIAMLKTEQKPETKVSQHINYRTPQQNTLSRHSFLQLLWETKSFNERLLGISKNYAHNTQPTTISLASAAATTISMASAKTIP